MIVPAYQSDCVTIYNADVCEIMEEVCPPLPCIVLTDPPYQWYGHVESIRSTGHLDVKRDADWSVMFMEWTAQWFPALLKATADGGAAWVFASPHYVGTYLRLADLMGAFPSWRGAWPCGPSELVMGFGEIWPRHVHDSLSENTYGQDKALPVLGELLGLTAIADSEHPVVFDPFCGGGNSLIAALAADRKAIGVEIKPATCERAIRRVQHYEQTGGVVA